MESLFSTSDRVVYRNIEFDRDSALSDLREELIEAQESGGFDSDRLFVPAGTLSEIISRCDIERELRKYRMASSDWHKSFVRGSAKKIFVTLVYWRLMKDIPHFQDYEFNDGHLPIDYDMALGRMKDSLTLFTEDLHVFRSWGKSAISRILRFPVAFQ